VTLPYSVFALDHINAIRSSPIIIIITTSVVIISPVARWAYYVRVRLGRTYIMILCRYHCGVPLNNTVSVFCTTYGKQRRPDYVYRTPRRDDRRSPASGLLHRIVICNVILLSSWTIIIVVLSDVGMPPTVRCDITICIVK